MIFLITLCKEIRKRFHINDQLRKLTAALNPVRAMDVNVRNEIASLDELAKFVPRIFKGNSDSLRPRPHDRACPPNMHGGHSGNDPKTPLLPSALNTTNAKSVSWS